MEKEMKSGHKIFLSLFTAAFVAFNAPVFAEDGKDHPMVSRYPGTSISHYDFKEFEEAQLILSKPYEKNGEWVADKVLPVEGQVTYIHYTKPDTVSALQIFRNYQTALSKSGFKELFVCNRPCTEQNISDFKDLLKARELFLNYSRDNQYLAAQNGNIYVSMFVNEGGVWLFVIEKGEMATDKISVVGNSPIAAALNKSGRVDVYGLTFDTGKSTLKPSSKTTLDELAQTLADNPQMNLDVIGHTDNVGTEESNLSLSQERSDQVVAALVSDYGINPTRLNPLGKGQSQPVASNDSEKGKATNRRVEFVIQGSVAPASPTNASTYKQSATNSKQKESKQEEPKKDAEKPNLDSAIDTAKKIRSLF
jgi:outer membrane protein OmpA-like peptidoglycan-associated protein